MSARSPELQELSEQLQALDQQREALEAEIEELQAEQRAITEAIDALESLETGSTVQVPVGGGAYVRATVEDIDEVIVDIGSDFATEQERDDAVETLSTKRSTLEDRVEEVSEEISEVEGQIEELEAEAQQMQQQMQQQALQQMQQQQQGDDGP